MRMRSERTIRWQYISATSVKKSEINPEPRYLKVVWGVGYSQLRLSNKINDDLNSDIFVTVDGEQIVLHKMY